MCLCECDINEGAPELLASNLLKDLHSTEQATPNVVNFYFVSLLLPLPLRLQITLVANQVLLKQMMETILL